jgi:hypothetical protein
MNGAFRFVFKEDVSVLDAELSLHLAIFAIEGLFGAARVRLDASYAIDESRRVIVVDASNEVGESLVRVFTNLLLREFGDDSLQVERVDAHPTPSVKAAA